MSQFSREHMKTLCDIFDAFALKDQDLYYCRTVDRYRSAANQVNLARASFAALGGIASALVLVASQVGWPQEIKFALIILAIVSPVLGVAINTLSDLYQWDRLVRIYEESRKSLVVADAQSPPDEIEDDVEYRGHLDAFVEATLQVMREETSQWGQLIQPPQQTQQFIDRAQVRVADTSSALADQGDDNS